MITVASTRRLRVGRRQFASLAVYIAFVALFIVFSVTLRNVGSGFASLGNLMNILRQTSLICIMGVGMVFALGAAQIDLSVGSVVGVVSLVTALTVEHFGIALGVIAGILSGALIGAFNGALVAYIRVPAFLATLGSLTVFAGVSRTMTNLQSVPILDPKYNFVFGGGSVGFFPLLAVWMIVVVLVGALILAKTRYGREVIAVGSNQTAAFYSGVQVKRVVFMVMLVSGALAGLAGVLWTGRFGGGRYSLGEGSELSVIAAAVLGGTSIYGGKATVLGAAVGAIMLGMIDNALILYGLDVYQQQIIRGLIIILAVAVTTSRE